MPVRISPSFCSGDAWDRAYTHAGEFTAAARSAAPDLVQKAGCVRIELLDEDPQIVAVERVPPPWIASPATDIAARAPRRGTRSAIHSKVPGELR